jgi:hypothetical protein
MSDYFRCGHTKAPVNNYRGQCHACKKAYSRRHAQNMAKHSKIEQKVDWQGWSDQLSERERQWLAGYETCRPDPFGLFASPW